MQYQTIHIKITQGRPNTLLWFFYIKTRYDRLSVWQPDQREVLYRLFADLCCYQGQITRGASQFEVGRPHANEIADGKVADAIAYRRFAETPSTSNHGANH